MRVDSGDVAWVLVATALVWLMLLPGLALFYGGLVRAKNLLSVLAQVLGIAAVTVLVWVGWGYSLAFAKGSAMVGGLGKIGMAGIGPAATWPLATPGEALPELLFACFQMTFAAVATALVIGALVEPVWFSAILAFSVLFLTIVYAPLAHMAWSPDGLLFALGAIDFAGVTVVHINAGIAGLVGMAMAGPRIGHLKEAMPPHSLALVMIGAGLLWVGWIGFNAGSALEANGVAALALLNTLVAPAAGVLAWMAAERWRPGKPSMLGGASGAVASLVAVTRPQACRGRLARSCSGVFRRRLATRSSPRPRTGSAGTTASTCGRCAWQS